MTDTCRCKTRPVDPAEDRPGDETYVEWNRRCPIHGIPPRRPPHHYDEVEWRASQKLIKHVMKLMTELMPATYGIQMSNGHAIYGIQNNYDPRMVKAARARLVAESREVDRIVREYVKEYPDD